MPRTKVRSKISEKPVTVSQIKQAIIKERNAMIEELDSLYDNLIAIVKEAHIKELTRIPQKFLVKTIGEIFLMDGISMSSLQSSSTYVSCIMDTISAPKPLLKRSLSSVDDEGYLTTDCESNGSSGSTRMSRSKTRTAKKTRVSRSLSKPKPNIAYKTPSNKVPLPLSTFTVTPKINPRTPQTILRRPKPGETAISLDGSPLLVGNTIGDYQANVNIPLADGSQISIQPRRGLRKSQLPDLNPTVLSQLQALRDNINCILKKDI